MDDAGRWLLHLDLLPSGLRCAGCYSETVALVATDGEGAQRGLCARCAREPAALRALVAAACPRLAAPPTPLLLYVPAIEQWLTT